VNWASGYDASGRPIEIAGARQGANPRDSIPGPFGARNWHSMSFNPQTGLVYMPVQHVPLTLADDKNWKHNANTPGQPMSGVGWNTGVFINAEPPKATPFGRLIAWDPIRQREAWRVENVSPWNGGTLATAGNLVFQGTADGRFVAYDARDGRKLWDTPTGTGVVAAPVTYMVDGRQYVSIAVGWGGVYGLMMRHTERQGPGTVYTFAVGGKAERPPFVAYRMEKLIQGVSYNKDHVTDGTLLYVSNCVFCHGVPGVDRGGNISNLGYTDPKIIENLAEFVYKGPANERGMPDFTGKLSKDEVEKIKAFIAGTADAIRPKP
jgi:quinohemoprotein ethanol dehydrogenase